MLKNTKTGRLAAFLIDGANLHASCKLLGFNVDFKKLIASFDDTIYKAFYFTALPPASEPSTLRPLVDFITFNGYTLISKDTKEFDQSDRFQCRECNHTNVINSVKTKGNMDVEIVQVANEIAPYINDLYLFSGDGDFRYMVEALQRQHGVHVTVVSTIKTRPWMCADILRRQADHFIDLADMRENIERSRE